jgi:hypothetical protein
LRARGAQHNKKWGTEKRCTIVAENAVKWLLYHVNGNFFDRENSAPVSEKSFLLSKKTFLLRRKQSRTK